MTNTGNPILVNRYRGDLIESQHRGSIAVCDPKGRIIKSWGDVDRLVYPRSAIKALQALPLIESGAADSYQLSSAEIALACSSHSAESFHIEKIQAWLERLGLEQNQLECGAHNPLNSCAANDLLIQNQKAGKIHNNCSGKHTGMLTIVCHQGESVSGYIDRSHPAQKRWINAVSQMAEIDMHELPASFDGCGIPVFAMPLRNIAAAFARFASPDGLSPNRIDAIARIKDAVRQHPELIAGTDRLGSELMAITGERVFVKSGAEGVYVAAIPGRNLGIALKIDDGLGSAAEVAMLATLEHLDCLDEPDIRKLQHRIRVPITNTTGVKTGEQVASIAFD